MTDLFGARVRALGDTFDDPDWSDVHRRAACARSRRTRRALVLAAAVSVLVIVIVTPAFGVRGAVSDLFGREDVNFEQTPTAPSVTKREFASMSTGAPAGMDPGVVAGQTRLAGTFKVGGVERALWVAPTAAGGFCYLWQHLGGGCLNGPREPGQIKLDGSFVLRPGSDAPTMEKLAGIVYDDSATELRLTFEDGRTAPLRFIYISQPINAGFFAYNPTAAEQEVGHRPLRLTLLNADGATLARASVDWQDEQRKVEQIQSMSPAPGSPTGAPRAAIESRKRVLTRARTENGHELSLWVAPMRGGGTCYWTNLRASRCVPPSPTPRPNRAAPPIDPKVLNTGLLSNLLVTGARPVLVWGPVPQGATSIELRFQDGSIQSLTPIKGWALAVIPERRYAAGHRLQRITAKAASGRVIASQPISTVDANYPCLARGKGNGHGSKVCG